MNASHWIRGGLSAFVVVVGLGIILIRDDETELAKRGSAAMREAGSSAEESTGSHSDAIAKAPEQILDESASPVANTGIEAFVQRIYQRLTPEFLAEFTQGRGQTAENLVFASIIGGETSYLYQAASLFPDNPQVQLQLTKLGGPQDRAAALAAFRKLDPDNALGDFLAARQSFAAGDPQAALEAIRQGQQKAELHEYELKTVQSGANAYLNAGCTGVEATLGSLCFNTTEMRTLAFEDSTKALLALQKEESLAGDKAAAETSVQAGLAMSQFYLDHSNSVVSQLHGISMELRFLKLLPESSVIPGSNEPKMARVAALEASRDEIKALGQVFETKIKLLNGTGINEYASKVKESSEMEAMRWLRDRKTD